MIKLQIDPSYAAIIGESIWGEQQTITTQPDGSIHFEATMSGKESIKKWIRSMGTNAKVLEPKSLRDEMIEEIREQLKMYGE